MEHTQFQDHCTIGAQTYRYFSIAKAAKALDAPDLRNLPATLTILAENLLRHAHKKQVRTEDIQALAAWYQNKASKAEIFYHPARVLMQDFTGVPAIVDLAAMRDAMVEMGKDPTLVNPKCPVDLVIDHSVQVDHFGHGDAYNQNVNLEMLRNKERYEFLKWGQTSFDNFKVVPPGMGICHQINLEYLGQVVRDKDGILYPDTLVGTDSHTTMINGLSILGWGVGGIEAEAAMLGQPISLAIPEVVGVYVTETLKPGITATDLVLTITQILRQHKVVGKFVEFFGPGLSHLSLADRATIANMAPEYGATCGFFPVDDETLAYMRLTGRDEDRIALVETYAKAQGLWHNPMRSHNDYSSIVQCDLSTIEPSLAGPKRPQDRVLLSHVPETLQEVMAVDQIANDGQLTHGDIVVAAITSCTNTSNPDVLIAAGLLAKNAIEKGLNCQDWVKCSLAPGSRVVKDYLSELGLLAPLEQIGFYLVGFGCTTCIGNSGPLPEHIAKAIDERDLYACAVLSGNRNFEGRIHPQIRGNWLASPPLVVAYALKGHMRDDLHSDPLGFDPEGNPIFLKDIWPSDADIRAQADKIHAAAFTKEYATIFDGDQSWQNMQISEGKTYDWHNVSTYIRRPSFFLGMSLELPKTSDVQGARILALLGDSVTTDHISPAGNIAVDSPAGQYLHANHVAVDQFNSYGSRRGNHEVMMRGTFANIRIRNRMTPDIEGGFTKHIPSNEVLPIYDAAMRYQAEKTPLVVMAQKEYGTGSSRDWAAKGTLLLGVKCVIAESFERIHRSNLIGMGVLPCEFASDQPLSTLNLGGHEQIDVIGITSMTTPNAKLTLRITREDGSQVACQIQTRIDTNEELRYYQNGGILQTVLRDMASA